jgi:hypothetical protein
MYVCYVYTWGCGGRYGALGNNDEDDKLVPTKMGGGCQIRS